MTNITESLAANLADAFSDGGFAEIRVHPQSIVDLSNFRLFLAWLRDALPRDARFLAPIMVAPAEDRLCFRFRSVEFAPNTVTRIDLDKFDHELAPGLVMPRLKIDGTTMEKFPANV